MRNNGIKAGSSQAKTVEDRYFLNPEDRQYYVDMFKSLVCFVHVRYFRRMWIVMDIFLVKRQHAIFRKVVYLEKSLSNCFRCVIAIKMVSWIL